MKIVTQGEGRNFEAALHFVIKDKSDYLYGASFAGFPSAVWAIDAALCGYKKVKIQCGEDEFELYPKANLRHLEKKVDRLTHVLILPKSSLLIEDDKEHIAPVVLAWDGDLRKAIGQYLAYKYSLPWEWTLEYQNLFCIKELDIISNPEYGEVQLRAAVIKRERNSVTLTPEDVDTAINSALISEKLRVPPSEVMGVYNEGDNLQDYLKTNAHVFAKQVDQIKPLYNPAKVTKLNPVIAKMNRIPFPVQAHAIQAITELFKRQGCALLNGDMGTGKSTIALGVAKVLSARKKSASILLTSPGLVIPKWCSDEIGNMIPDAKIIRIGSIDEARRYKKKGGQYEVVTAAEYLTRIRGGYKPEGLEFVVLSIDRAKFGPSTWFASILWKRIRGTTEKAWHCPDCGEVLTKEIDKETLLCGWKDFVSTDYEEGLFNLNGYARKKIEWKQKPIFKKCPKCNTPLMRPALKSRGETRFRPRWYAALILKKLGKHFDLYIADEVHESRAENSGRGFAFTQAVRSSSKTLCLTGTLVNGMSSSIKEILWRTNARALIEDGFDATTGTITWARRYGVLQQIVHEGTDDEGVATKRKHYQKSQPREKPGISPELVANHLLDKTVFIDLPDLGLPLVELKEIPVFVELDEEHRKRYKGFHKALYNECMEAYRSGFGGAFSQFIPNAINAVDRSDKNITVDVCGIGVRFEGFGADYINAKERELVKIVKENLAENRGCIIHCFYTGKFGIHLRLKKVMDEFGIKSAVMRPGIKQEERIAWLDMQNKNNIKVIITNMRLISTGIDVLPWSTSIFYQLNYNADTLRQVSRRSWRPFQSRECRNYYMVALETQQMAQFKVCLEKRAHAMMTEGRLEKSELPNYISGSRMHLASDLAHCIADEDIGLKWSDLAGKDIEDVETCDEAGFKEMLRKTQENLCKETMRLCGVEKIEKTKTEKPVHKKPTLLDFHTPPKEARKKKATVPVNNYEQLALFLKVM